jgi:hypothetical protein
MNFAYALFNPRSVNPVTGELFVEYRTNSLAAALAKLSKANAKYGDNGLKVVEWNRTGRTITASEAEQLIYV